MTEPRLSLFPVRFDRYAVPGVLEVASSPQPSPPAPKAFGAQEEREKKPALRSANCSMAVHPIPFPFRRGGGGNLNSAMTDEVLEIQKRLTLNWLIQGAAQHAGMTFHHLVRDELDALDPRLLLLYDQYALINLLQYWHAEGALLLGWPPRFWRSAASDPRHPFFAHPLLSRF